MNSKHTMTEFEILTLINKVAAEKGEEQLAYEGANEEIEALVAKHQAQALKNLALRFQIEFLKRKGGK